MNMIIANYMLQYGQTLLDLGYRIIPLPIGKKGPVLKGWQHINATGETVIKWAKGAGHGVGVVCGGPGGVIGIDIDCMETKIADEMQFWCFEHIEDAPVRYGQAPKCMLIYRCNEGETWRKMKSSVYRKAGKDYAIEILATGQQFVAYNRHPSGVDYKWNAIFSTRAAINELDNTRKDDLRVITMDQVTALFDHWDEVISNEGGFALVHARNTDGGRGQREEFATAGTRTLERMARGEEDDTASLERISATADQRPVPGLTIADIAEIIGIYNADDRTVWAENIGPRVHHQTGGSEEGFQVWNAWSQGSEKYNEADCRRVWNSYGHRGGNVSLPDGTVVVPRLATMWPLVGTRRRMDAERLMREEEEKKSGDRNQQKNNIVDGKIAFINARGRKVEWFGGIIENGVDPRVVLAEWLDGLVYSKEDGLVIDLAKPAWIPGIKIDNWKEANCGMEYIERIGTVEGVGEEARMKWSKPRAVSLTTLWRKHQERKIAFRRVYEPAAGRVVHRDGELYVNSFWMPDHESVLKRAEIDWRTADGQRRIDEEILEFKVLLEHVFPGDGGADARWIAAWMARMVQTPWAKSMVTPLSVTLTQGTGRGTIEKVLRSVLGQNNCANVDIAELATGGNGFNDFFDDKLLCCVEETENGKQKYAIESTMRRILTTEFATVNIKHVAKANKRVYTNFFLMSNEPDALQFTDKDRRIYVMDGAKSVYGDGVAIYKHIHQSISAENGLYAACVWGWLKSVRLDGVNFERAPMNEAKKVMRSHGVTDVEEACAEFWEERMEPGKGYRTDDIIEDLKEHFNFDSGTFLSQKQVCAILRKLGGVYKVVREKGTRKTAKRWVKITKK